MTEHLEHERPRRRRRWAIIAAVAAALVVASGGAGAAVAIYLASGNGAPEAAQPSPTTAADVIGERVCTASVEMVGDVLESGMGWGEDEWHAWWDDAYDQGERLKVTNTGALQDIGHRADNTDPGDMSDLMLEVAVTCTDEGLLKRDQLHDTVLDAVEGLDTSEG